MLLCRLWQTGHSGFSCSESWLRIAIQAPALITPSLVRGLEARLSFIHSGKRASFSPTVPSDRVGLRDDMSISHIWGWGVE